MIDKLTNTIKEYKNQIIDSCADIAEDILHQNIDNADCYKMGWEIVNGIKALKEGK